MVRNKASLSQIKLFVSVDLSPARPRGFTLIELLVVVAIIGLLSSIALASLNTARDKARNAATFAQMKFIERSIRLMTR